MTTAGELLAQRIDAMPLRGVILRVPVLCTLVMVFEGMDNNIISYVGPLIRQELDLSATILGLIYTATVVAALIGAAGIAPLSDRFGRRPLLLLSNLVMIGCTLATPFLTTAWALVIVRFIVGIAFGAAVPTSFALAADYAPNRYRARLIMIVTAGVALGYVCSGFLSAAVIPMFGWRPMMLGLAALSALWTGMLFILLPESPQFLVARRIGEPRTATLFLRLGIAASDMPSRIPVAQGDAPHSADRPGLRALLSKDYRPVTMMTLYVVCSIYAVELLLAHWLPAILMERGFSVGTAATITAVGKMASIAGSIVVGWLMDRRGLLRMLSVSFFCAACALALVALGFSMPILLVPAILCMSFFVDGSFSGSQALTVTSYPTSLRATASGWITGVSRLVGGGLGTFAGGAFIAAGLAPAAILLLLVAIMMLAGGMLMLIGHRRTIAVPPATNAPLQSLVEVHPRSSI